MKSLTREELLAKLNDSTTPFFFYTGSWDAMHEFLREEFEGTNVDYSFLHLPQVFRGAGFCLSYRHLLSQKGKSFVQVMQGTWPRVPGRFEEFLFSPDGCWECRERSRSESYRAPIPKMLIYIRSAAAKHIPIWAKDFTGDELPVVNYDTTRESRKFHRQSQNNVK